MRNKLLLSILAFFILISITTEPQLPFEPKANPWLLFTSVDPLPGTIPPTITVLSPQNNTAYDSDTILLSFRVTKPQPPTELQSGVSEVFYYLDDNRSTAYFCNHYSSNAPPGLPEFTYSVNLTLPKGGHYIKIDAGGVVLPGGMTIYRVGSSTTIVFSTKPDPTTTPYPITDAEAITILSPHPKEYVSNGTPIDIPLTISIRGTASWMQYSVLGTNAQQNYRATETIHENTTLRSLPIGSYVLILYVNNTFTSITTQFNVTLEDYKTSPTPTSPPTNVPPKPTANPATTPQITQEIPSFSPPTNPPSTATPTVEINLNTSTLQLTSKPTYSANEDKQTNLSHVPSSTQIGYAIVAAAIAASAFGAGIILYFFKKFRKT